LIEYPAGSSGADALFVFAHGAGAGQRHPFMVAYASALADQGIHVVTFDFPYMAQGRRAPDRAALLEEAFRDAITRAREGRESLALFVGGKSMGGRMATHLAAGGTEAAGVMTLGYPLHPPGKPEQKRTAHFPGIRMPWLIVQGERDTFGTPAELTPEIEAVPGEVQLHVVAGADHSLAVRGRKPEVVRAEVVAVMVDFIRRAAG
jgi:uncharacterized protein